MGYRLWIQSSSLTTSCRVAAGHLPVLLGDDFLQRMPFASGVGKVPDGRVLQAMLIPFDTPALPRFPSSSCPSLFLPTPLGFATPDLGPLLGGTLYGMAKPFILLALVANLLSLLSCTVADVEITDIFTVQPGASDGGCDSRAAVLDQWLSECLESLGVAISAIDEYDQDIRVRRSMSSFFGISNNGPLRGNGDRTANVETVKRAC